MNQRTRLLICTMALVAAGPMLGCRHLKVIPHEGFIEFEVLTVKNPRSQPCPRASTLAGCVWQKGNTKAPAYLSVYRVQPDELPDVIEDLCATVVTTGDVFSPVMEETRY